MNTTKSLSRNGNSIVLIAVFVMLMCNYACPNPMMYKRNPGDIYERDLVPVSSTVIPLTVLEVSYGQGGKPSEEYKEAYLKKLRKKVREHDKNESDNQENPDTLITIKKKQNVNNEKDKDKVKASIITAQTSTEAGMAQDSVN